MDGVINTSSTLAQDLVVLGGSRGDLVNGGPWRLSGTGSSLVPTPYGVGVKATTSGDCGYFSFPSRVLLGASSLTVSVFASFPSVPDYGTLLCVPEASGYGTAQILFYQSITPLNGRILFGTAPAGATAAVTTSVYFLAGSLWHHYAVTIGNGVAKWYRDGGYLYQSAYNGAFVGGLGSGAMAQLALFCPSSLGPGGQTSQQTGSAAAPAIWRRALGASEIAQIAVNPFAMVKKL